MIDRWERAHEQQVGTAKVIASMAHRDQVDKAGKPYIGHPIRVVRRLAGESWQVRAAAWLHDVLEDSDFTEGDLVENGIDLDVVEAVVLLSRVEGQSSSDYYEGVSGNEIALKVKLADIADNMDAMRLSALDDRTIVRLVRKYGDALDRLGGSYA